MTARGRNLFLTACNRKSVCFVELKLRAHPSIQQRIIHFLPSWRDTFLIHIAVINHSFTGSLIIHCSHEGITKKIYRFLLRSKLLAW